MSSVTPASADVTCVPITVDGQPVFCADLSPVTDPVDGVLATVVATVDSVVATVDGVAAGSAGTPLCLEQRPQLISIAFEQNGQCRMFYVTSDPPLEDVVGPTTMVPVHVPQVCLTTTNTCVGPFDELLPVPGVTTGFNICLVEGRWDPNQPIAQTYYDVHRSGDCVNTALL